MSKESILICGANGATGRLITNLINDHINYEAIAIIRKQSQSTYFKNRGIKTAVADLTEDLGDILPNIDKVIFAAGSKGKDVTGVDQNAAKKMIDAAKKLGVKKFVMLSTMGADNPSISDELKNYLQAKQNADKYLKQSGLNYCIVRPGMLTNDKPTDKIDLAEKLVKFGKITRTDVAKTLFVGLDDSIKQNETFEIMNGETVIEKAMEACN
jgi:uncharacterized protein YbjT (DUF2867 family)